ncbi:MAG: trimethylamine methyltransferase [Acidaminobacter sp.]|uniref:trimethylamine methyltransferase family protein n=1 Tax=Acidaminobacter sp. TaxID=1872102 RepID=UPI00137FB548|nr:trimethylamine methyltransferase family protein [Acidaminobacter sp.]MZQ97487.1 trimethylamine methyltransferase [Acidaminobacter sp.]
MSTIVRTLNVSILGQENIERIHEASLYLLEHVGMKMTGDRTIEKLREKGAVVEGDLIKFPRLVVEAALKTVPKEVTLYTRDGQPNMVINSKNNVYFGTHADQLEFLDYKTNKARAYFKDDIKTMCSLADSLPNISFILSVGMCSDVDPAVQSQVTFLETVKNFSKTINFSTNDIESLQEIIDIAAVVAGGHKELQEKPFIFNYCEPIPPLTHPLESTEKLFISASNRIPVVYMPYSMMGGTAPVSIAGALTQNNAEILAGVVITQAVNEGAPIIYGSMPTVFDMQTTVGSYAAPEFHLAIAAAAEMADFYGLPFYGTAACSDAKTVDPQAVAEASMELFSTSLSKANIIHDIGVMDHCNSVSPAMVVIASEIINQLRSYCKGVEVNDDTIGLNVIQEVGFGGHYLQHEHTFNNFRSIWYPELFSRRMMNPDDSDLMERVNVKIDQILEQHIVPELDKTVLESLAEWEKKYSVK